MDGGQAISGVEAAFAALAGVRTAPGLAERRAHLGALMAAVRRAAEPLARAVDADFGGRPRAETMVAEVGLVLTHAAWTRRRLAGWMKPQRPGLPPELLGGRARVERVPLGVVGVLSPWNYPIQLALLPVVAALAGGNRVLLKPSEHAPRTAEALLDLLHGALPADTLRVVTGGADVAEAVTRLPLDGLFYTGGTATARKVLAAAAENLVPTVLELGGKSPAILLPGADLDRAAAAIMSGKLFSAGQTCIAPDYLLVPEGRTGEVVEALRRAAARLYPNPADYAALLRPGARERLLALMEGRGVPLLDRMPEAPRLGPFAVPDADPEGALMREEIFGPVLPVLPYATPADAVAFSNARPCPLALYAFGPGAEAVVRAARSGGAMIDGTLLQAAAPALPFGGAGESGMGSYHGEEGFRALTRPRTVLRAARWSLANMVRPPYGAQVERVIRLLLR
jgi:coniferyl-aldehyde dehydrogenase